MILAISALLGLQGPATPAANEPPQLAADQVVERMVEADQRRSAELAGYTGTRRYRFENERFDKRAEMTVRVVCLPSGAKSFAVVAEDGSSFVRGQILRRIVEAERQASQKGERQQSRILPQNYDFRLIGTEAVEGRPSYVLQVIPKTSNKYLIRGNVWVDAADYAIARIEGRPAKNPSIWLKSVKISQQYGKTGDFWLPVRNSSWADARIFGPTDLSIEYFDYVVTDPSPDRP